MSQREVEGLRSQGRGGAQDMDFWRLLISSCIPIQNVILMDTVKIYLCAGNDPDDELRFNEEGNLSRIR